MYYANNGDPFASNKNNDKKVVEKQAVWRGTNCYAKISLINLKVSAIATLHGSTVPWCYKVSWGQIEACLR